MKVEKSDPFGVGPCPVEMDLVSRLSRDDIPFWKRAAVGRMSPSAPRTVEVALTMPAPHAFDWHRLELDGSSSYETI